MEPIQIFLYIIIILSAVFHEFAHAWMADRLGDPTAKNLGRLTLNPIPHIDPFGTVILPLLLLVMGGFFIGWAKPVPYNPYNLRDPKYGSLKVGAAGPAANLVIALILGLFLRVVMAGLLPLNISAAFLQLVGIIVYINIFLALFNLIPIPPLDGSKIFMDLFPRYGRVVAQLGFMGMFLALIIAFYILSPIAGFLFRALTGSGFGI